MAREVSHGLWSSQPRSSQSQRDDDPEETTERAFWQSTPTALQELISGGAEGENAKERDEDEEWHRQAARE